MFKADGMFGGTLKKMGVMIQSGGGSHMIVMIVFVVVVFLIIYFIVSGK
jgi:blocked-early-in-transport protein 1